MDQKNKARNKGENCMLNDVIDILKGNTIFPSGVGWIAHRLAFSR
jgi:hypothetical protein